MRSTRVWWQEGDDKLLSPAHSSADVWRTRSSMLKSACSSICFSGFNFFSCFDWIAAAAAARAAAVRRPYEHHLVVMQAALTSRGRQYILLAVVKERTDRRVAEYLCQKLPSELSKAFKRKCCSPSSKPHSPLYSTLLKICSNYKTISAYSESIFAYTETTAVVIDVKAGTLTRVNYGSQALAALVLDSLGQPCQPTSSQKHYMDNTFIHEDSFSNFQGQHRVVIGSPGLW
jgi:hypothetical protein